MSYEHACGKKYMEAEAICYGASVNCDALSGCQERRGSCNFAIKSGQSCDQLTSCLQTRKEKKIQSLVDSKKISKSIAKAKRNNSSCLYSWYNSACNNENILTDRVAAKCPGRAGWFDDYPDKNMDCEGQKKRFNAKFATCKKLWRDYDKTCKNVRDYKYQKLTVTVRCPASKITLPSPDSIYSGSPKTFDSSRTSFGKPSDKAPGPDDGTYIPSQGQ